MRIAGPPVELREGCVQEFDGSVPHAVDGYWRSSGVEIVALTLASSYLWPRPVSHLSRFGKLPGMAAIKTTVNDANVKDFINKVEDETKKEDSLALLKLFSKVTGEKPKMWGSSIIGFGQYHYKSEKSRQEGDWMLTGFSPRKQNLTLYVMPGFGDYQDLLKDLGKHKTSVGCLYINKLADVDMKVLEKLITKTFKAMKAEHT
jgi:hypothetical protein